MILRRFRPGAIAWLVAILCLVYVPLFWGDILFFRDAAHWNYPARWFLRDSILRGDFPSWNPLQGLGFSVFGNPLYGIFYPPNWLYALTPASLVASMVTWQAFAHVVWGAAGLSVLARQFGLGGAPACVAGLAWGLSGFTTATWSAGLLLLAGAWLPWCGVGFVHLGRNAAAGGAAWLGAVVRATLPVTMAVLLGEIFVAMMGVGFGIATAAVAVHVDRRAQAPAPRAPRANGLLLAAVAATLALAAGIGAIVVIPARAIAAATERAVHLPRDWAEICSLHPLRLMEFVAPGSMGFAFGSYPAAVVVGEPRLDGLPLMYSVYMGASVVLLAVLGLGRGRRAPALIGGLALVALLVSLGRHAPVHELLRTAIPPLRYMRYPEKYLVVFLGWLALLAGFGAQRILTEPVRPWVRSCVFVGALIVLCVRAPAVFPADWAYYVRLGAGQGAIVAAAVLAAQFLAIRRARFAAALLTVVVAADLGMAAVPHLGFGPSRVATDTPPAALALSRDYLVRGGGVTAPRLYRSNAVEGMVRKFVPVETYAGGERRSVATLIENTVTTFGIATLPGYDAAIPTVLPKLWYSGKKVGQNVLRLLGIDYAILPIENPAERVERRTGIEPMMDPLPGSRLYRVPGTLPRVYLAGRSETASDAVALKRLFEPEVVAGGLALLASGAPGQPVAGAAEQAGRCVLELFSNSRIEARCQAARPAVAVFIEQHDRGWTAQVDGRAAPLLRANLLMRAVRLGPGDHRVVLSYTPPGIGVAAPISIGAVLLLCGLAVAAAMTRRGRAWTVLRRP